MSIVHLKASVNYVEQTIGFFSSWDANEETTRTAVVAMLRILADNLEANHDSDWWTEGWA